MGDKVHPIPKNIFREIERILADAKPMKIVLNANQGRIESADFVRTEKVVAEK